MKRTTILTLAILMGPCCALGTASAAPLGTAITYQGALRLDGSLVNDTADFQFRLFDAATGGTAVSSVVPVNSVDVVEGLFTVSIDFGSSAFNGDARWMEILVRSPAGSGAFTTLNPRQALTAAPYALKARGVDGHSLDAVDGSPVDTVYSSSAGNVGIGTTAPVTKLYVDESSNASAVVTIDSGASSTQQSAIDFRDRGVLEWGMGKGFGNEFYLDDVGSGRRVTIPAGSGMVGISTTAPVAGLHVNREPQTFGGTLALEGTTHTYMSFFPDGIAAGRKGFFGFSTSGSDEIALVNEVPGKHIGFYTDGGVLRFRVESGGGIHIPNLGFVGDFHNVQWTGEFGSWLGYDDSTRRHKENITPLVVDFERLLDAQPMTYTRPGRPDRWEIGYIAEEMLELGLTQLVHCNREGLPESVNYEKSTLYLVEIARSQRRQIREQQDRLTACEQAIRALTDRLADLETRSSN